MESSYTAEKSLSEGENPPESCLINMLRNDISRKVVINDGGTMNYMNDVQKVPAEGHYIEKYQGDEEDEDDDDEENDYDFSEEELLAQMGYGKSEPKRVMKKEHRKQYSGDDDEDEDEDEDEDDDDLLEESLLAKMGYLKKKPPKHEPISTPTAALNLVSALKGSREKEGNKQARECRVSWAPDVYDPPSSTEHFATTNIPRHNSEHKVKHLAGKNGQKMGGKGAGGLEDGRGRGDRGNKVGGNQGTVGGGGKAGVKNKDRKQVKKKHGGSPRKNSNLDDC